MVNKNTTPTTMRAQVACKVFTSQLRVRTKINISKSSGGGSGKWIVPNTLLPRLTATPLGFSTKPGRWQCCMEHEEQKEDDSSQ